MANVIGRFAVGEASSVERAPETLVPQLRAVMNAVTRAPIRTANTD
jgi:hypothetical protein